MIPQMVAGLSAAEAGQRADQLLKLVGLERRASHRPAKLSGGEQQRVAIMRAVANVTQVIPADEPNGKLDPQTAAEGFSKHTQIVRDHLMASLDTTSNLSSAAPSARPLNWKHVVERTRR